MGIFGGPKMPDPLPPPAPLPPSAHPATLGSSTVQAPVPNKKAAAGFESTIATSPQGLELEPQKAKTTLLGG